MLTIEPPTLTLSTEVSRGMFNVRVTGERQSDRFLRRFEIKFSFGDGDDTFDDNLDSTLVYGAYQHLT